MGSFEKYFLKIQFVILSKRSLVTNYTQGFVVKNVFKNPEENAFKKFQNMVQVDLKKYCYMGKICLREFLTKNPIKFYFYGSGSH